MIRKFHIGAVVRGFSQIMLDRISYKARGRMLACSTLKDKLQIYIQLRWSGPCKTQAHARNYCSFCMQKVQDTLYGTLTSQIRALWRSFPWQRDEVQRMHRYKHRPTTASGPKIGLPAQSMAGWAVAAVGSRRAAKG